MLDDNGKFRLERVNTDLLKVNDTERYSEIHDFIKSHPLITKITLPTRYFCNTVFRLFFHILFF